MQITKLTKRLLSSPALSLIISLVLAALTLFGITSSVMAARVLLGLAVLVGMLGCHVVRMDLFEAMEACSRRRIWLSSFWDYWHGG